MSDYNLLGASPAPMIAVAAISINTFVKLEATTDRGVTTSTAGTDVLTCGVAMESQATIGGPVAVQTIGIAKVKAGNSITRGAQVTSDGTGRAVTVATGNVGLGVCLNTVGAANEIAEIMLSPLPNLNGPLTP